MDNVFLQSVACSGGSQMHGILRLRAKWAYSTTIGVDKCPSVKRCTTVVHLAAAQKVSLEQG